MRSTSLYFLVTGLALLALAACSTTHYSYVPPQTDTGRLCTAQCENSKVSCINALTQASNQCRLQNNLTQLSCQAMNKNDDKNKGNPCSTIYNFCNYSDQQCIQGFNTCYASCGGQVITTKD